MKPKASVLICSYNAEKFIQSTVQSVLYQTYKDFELLILDNNSKDDTVKIIKTMAEKDKRIVLFEEKSNLGSYPGLNYLLERSNGKYIAINDHDDIWHPEKLTKQIDFLEKNTGYVGCGTAILNRYEQYGNTVYRFQPEEADIAWHTSLVFRNNGYRYDASVKVGTDFYFMKNILSGNKKSIYNFPEPMVLRRIFRDNLSGQWMKGTPIKDILTLQIGWIDKLALLNRRILPQELIEKVLLSIYSGNLPEKYGDFAKTLMNSL